MSDYAQTKPAGDKGPGAPAEEKKDDATVRNLREPGVRIGSIVVLTAFQPDSDSISSETDNTGAQLFACNKPIQELGKMKKQNFYSRSRPSTTRRMRPRRRRLSSRR